jgi:hypothetical protein
MCSVFSAFAVEHALAELIWVRCFFQTPEPYRRITLQHAEGLRTIPARIGFLRATTAIPAELIEDMGRLFEYRNGIAHCRVSTFEGIVRGFDVMPENVAEGDVATYEDAQPVLMEKLDKHIELPGLGTEDLNMAEQNLRTAERAVEALRIEMDSEAWPTFGPADAPGSGPGSQGQRKLVPLSPLPRVEALRPA